MKAKPIFIIISLFLYVAIWSCIVSAQQVTVRGGASWFPKGEKSTELRALYIIAISAIETHIADEGGNRDEISTLLFDNVDRVSLNTYIIVGLYIRRSHIEGRLAQMLRSLAYGYLRRHALRRSAKGIEK